jgi:hypothetical protein
MARTSLIFLTGCVLLLAACGSSTGKGADAGAGADQDHHGTGGSPLVPGGEEQGDGGGLGNGEACASETAQASLRPVALAFAFDVSGSMGKGDTDWHDRELKWDPVVAATQAFFTDPESNGISASLTFFPAASDRCDADQYESPDVPLTALPSTVFGNAIDAITPQSSSDWRGGTPTLAVVQGTLDFLDGRVSANPDALHALVLVTDGYPQSCDDDSISSVAAAVAAVSGTIPTYVIGVRNPEGGPDTVSDLDAIAAVGGTGHAFLIATGDPEQTKTAFREVIDGIRGASVSCDLEIPPPPAGETFDPKKVNVTLDLGASQRSFSQDQTCTEADTWRYDDPSQPRFIELCPSTCTSVRGAPQAQLLVEFGCASRVVVR